jgi:hypothetical protein
MKKNMKWLGLGGLLGAALLTAIDLPAGEFQDDLMKSCMTTVKKDCEVWAAKGGGGEAPRGLNSDTKVELAIGEKYVLTGLIEIYAGRPYLRVSFKEQPWLANARRMRNPTYRLNDLATNWSKYAGQEMTIIGTAHYRAFSNQGSKMLEIFLEPSPEAVVEGLQRKRRHY